MQEMVSDRQYVVSESTLESKASCDIISKDDEDSKGLVEYNNIFEII